MKQPLIALALLLAACSQEPAQQSAEAPAQAATEARSNAPTEPWFLCDALDAPSIFVMAKSQDNRRLLVTEYSKADGRPAWRGDFALGEPEGAAGSVITPLLRNGAEAGSVRQINPGMLETPAAAYTTPYVSIQFGERDISCRWVARTRLMGFDERRTFVVHESANGDLIYTTYDFSTAQGRDAVDGPENSRTTAPSVNVRGGTQTTGPGGDEFRFENGDILYLVVAPTEAAAAIEVWRGDNQIQSETLIAQQTGQRP